MKTHVKLLLLVLLGAADAFGQGPPPISTINAGTNVTVTRSGPSVTISSTGGGGSNAINLSTSTGLANTASLSMASGTTISTSGSGTLSLSTGLNTFQTLSASSFALASQGGYFGSQAADSSGPAIKDSLGYNKAIFRQQGTISLAGGSDATVTATFGAPNTASTGTTSGAEVLVGGLGVQGAIYGTAATFSTGLTGSFSSFAALNTSTSYTLTTASPRRVLFTGSNGATTHTISVDATTQQIGAEWRLVNTGTASVTLKGNGGGTLGTAYTNSITLATLNSIATTSGSYTVQRIPLLDSIGRLAPGNSTFLGPNYLELNNGYIASGFTVSGSVQLGANNLTTSGTIKGATLTSSGDVNATSGTIRTSAFEATGNAQFSGSSVSISSDTITFSGIANTGATDFVGMVNPGSQIVSLTVFDAASLLGLPSSRTVKEDIAPMSGPDAVELLGKINVVHYRYTAASGQDYTKPHIGFIAEDVANVFPEGGNTVGPKSKLVPSVSDRDLLALLFSVVQEQQKEIEKLKAAK